LSAESATLHHKAISFTLESFLKMTSSSEKVQIPTRKAIKKLQSTEHKDPEISLMIAYLTYLSFLLMIMVRNILHINK
jgi:hypothetical protein